MKSMKRLRQISVVIFLLLAAAGKSMARSGTIVVTRNLSFRSITRTTTLAYNNATAAVYHARPKEQSGSVTSGDPSTLVTYHRKMVIL